MFKHHSNPHENSVLKRLFSLFAAVLIATMAFSLVQPAGSQANAQAASTPPPGTNWSFGIYKKASKPFLTTGEVMTYTIHLEIPNITTPVIYHADVSDPLPVGLDYVKDSATPPGTYDPTSRTLSWSQVAVSPGSPVDLTFDVTDTAVVTVPTPTVNTAIIKLNGLVLLRQAWVVLMPGPSTVPGLLASFKSADPFRLGPGDIVTYTIHLIESGNTTAVADVSDPVPGPLTYVDGSVSSGGVYDATSKTVTWSGISVSHGTPVLLTFQAQAPAVAFANPLPSLLIVNTATITSGAVSFKRSASVLLTPQPVPPLAGSFKMASRREVAPGEQFTYTIYLNNSSTVPVPATVTDKLPELVTYVAGSANAGGVYDETSRTLTWSGLSVPGGSSMALTFDVTAASTLPSPTPQPIRLLITNTAVIASGPVTLIRSAQVWLVPTPTGDNIPPVVDSFTIGDTDVYTSPAVTLNIKAHDNVAVTSMYLVEWVLTGKPIPHWQLVKTSGWIPYQASYPWTLINQSGTHFIGVWVADKAMNRSRLTWNAIDFASLLLPGTSIAQGHMIPYLVYYPAGVDVKAALTSTSGEAHLFLWKPGNMFAPDLSSAAPGSSTQTITFTTQTAGIYMFLVYGKTNAVFDLSITPGGGPRPGPFATPASSVSTPSLSDGTILTSPDAAADGITFNPILPQSGLDPLFVAPEPFFLQTYLPALSR
jgi:uncharacterized repeat protein (TIGR01451 family)